MVACTLSWYIFNFYKTLFPVLHDLYLAASLTEQNLSTVINSTESLKVYFI